ncbi:MAG: hypothetical protein EBQ75_00100 [Actinobacteria bacterium]|nr:hypothetical protein [Actinomycetota bacterium]
MRFMAADVANATGGKVVGQNAHLDGVSFDSRTLRPGQLFVPIVAERDGHDFIDDAVARGQVRISRHVNRRVVAPQLSSPTRLPH